jgi:exonuclease VII small subunit
VSALEPVALDPKKLAIKALALSGHNLDTARARVEDLVKDVHDRDIWSKVNLLADELDPIVSALEPVALDPKKLAIKALALSGHNLDTARARVEDLVKDVHDKDIIK